MSFLDIYNMLMLLFLANNNNYNIQFYQISLFIESSDGFREKCVCFS